MNGDFRKRYAEFSYLLGALITKYRDLGTGALSYELSKAIQVLSIVPKDFSTK